MNCKNGPICGQKVQLSNDKFTATKNYTTKQLKQTQLRTRI